MVLLGLMLFCGLVVFIVNSFWKHHEYNQAARYRQRQHREPQYGRQRGVYQQAHYPPYRPDPWSKWISVAVIIIILSLFVMMAGKKQTHVTKEVTPSNTTSMVITKNLD